MSPQDDTKIELLPPQGLSRRDFLARTAGTTAGLYALTQLESSPPARAQSQKPLGAQLFKIDSEYAMHGITVMPVPKSTMYSTGV